MTDGQEFVIVDDLVCEVRARRPAISGAIWRRRPLVRVVDGVSFAIPRGRTLGLVGESGSGKTTIARAMLGLAAAAGGRVVVGGEAVGTGRDAAWRQQRRRMQMVYQDAAGALDRRMTVAAQLREPLDIHNISNPSDRPDFVRLRLAEVGLGADLGERYPHELSGGQRQRVVLARALMVDPDLLVCDEPVSALDVSVQAQVLGLLEDLTAARGLTMLFISHDLRVIRHIADRIAVLYLGRIVEEGPAEAVLHDPQHPYTRALVVAAAVRRRDCRAVVTGEAPDPAARPAGCGFHPRCPDVRAVCRMQDPRVVTMADGRRVACHLRQGEGPA
ncbi:ABC transporter ATP-binding protein (plasmid) [Tistrella mobilis]|uniref:oligopeptide/dipeptide ABC transporter ATP-binding protein n=1 Tax=Tistrella mobilis TaxID=171437 RepID=UPI0035561682